MKKLLVLLIATTISFSGFSQTSSDSTNIINLQKKIDLLNVKVSKLEANQYCAGYNLRKHNDNRESAIIVLVFSALTSYMVLKEDYPKTIIYSVGIGGSVFSLGYFIKSFHNLRKVERCLNKG